MLAAVVALPVLAANEPREQTVTPITPPVEQRVDQVAPAGEQRVEALDAEGVQEVTGASSGGPIKRGANKVAKVVVGVFAAGVALGATVAALLFL